MNRATKENPMTAKKLTIWQQNINNSLVGQGVMVEEMSPDDIDVIAIQEPHIDFLGLSRAGNGWRAVYPSRHRTNRADTRSIILVSALVSSNAWFQIDVDSSDISAIMVITNDFNIAIFNIYNDCKHSDTLSTLNDAMEDTRRRGRGRTRFIILGDFNRHHPMWDEDRNTSLFTRKNLDEAQILIDFTTDWDLDMALPKGIPTLEHSRTKNLTRPDNIFMSQILTNKLTLCDVITEGRTVRTDHYPIKTVIDVSPERASYRKIQSLKKVKWEDF
jgi:hypothetical protein